MIPFFVASNMYGGANLDSYYIYSFVILPIMLLISFYAEDARLWLEREVSEFHSNIFLVIIAGLFMLIV